MIFLQAKRLFHYINVAMSSSTSKSICAAHLCSELLRKTDFLFMQQEVTAEGIFHYVLILHYVNTSFSYININLKMQNFAPAH